MRSDGQELIASHKNKIFAGTGFGYIDVNADDNALTGKCLGNLIKLQQLQQLSIGKINNYTANNPLNTEEDLYWLYELVNHLP
jgi:hypothetical protein